MKKTLLVTGLLGYLVIGFTSIASAQSASPSASASASPAASGKSIRDNLRERVEEKLTQLINKPRAFVGKITQISNSALTVDSKGGIKQVKVTDKTVLIQVADGKPKTIKESDLAVGNFVVAMGYVENKDTLSARRILTMSQDPRQARHPVYGIVQSAKDGTLVVKHPKKDETWTVKTSTKTEVTLKNDGKMGKSDFKSIVEGDRIIAVGIPVKNAAFTITAKLIHVIPGEAHGLLKSPTASPKATKSPTPKPTTTPAE